MKVDSDAMRRLVKYVVELTTQMRAEHSAALMGMPALDELVRRFPWVEREYYKRSYESYFQLALEEAMQKRKFMPVQLNEMPAEPWEPEAWQSKNLPFNADCSSRLRSFLVRWQSWRSSRWCTSEAAVPQG